MNAALRRVFAGCALSLLAACSPKPFQPALNQPCLEYLPQGFVYVDQVAPSVKVDLKYSGSDNFVGRPLNGYLGRRALLRHEAARHLAKAAAWLKPQGYGLLIYDAYRPHTAMIDIGRWGKDLSDQKMKARFYPGIEKKKIFDDLYIRDYSEHSRGVAVDITLVHLMSGKPLDMGGHHDFLDPSSATDSDLVTPAQKANRQLLRKAMLGAGFANYEPEWWHYRLSPEPDAEAHFYFPSWDGMKPEGVHSVRTARF